MDIRVGWPPDVVAKMQAPSREVFGEEREEILKALREALSEERIGGMTPQEFGVALSSALSLCQVAAGLRLPIEEMLAYLDETCEARGDDYTAEDAALREIIATVGEIAAIGAGLAGQEGAKPARATTEKPPERSFPLPANLREA